MLMFQPALVLATALLVPQASLPCELDLAAPVISPTGAASFPGGIDAADLDGDGVPEIVTANSFSRSFSILRYTGAGAFELVETLSFASGQARDAAFGDVTGDGLVDLVGAAEFAGGTLLVYPGKGGLQFDQPVVVGGLLSASQLELVDLDHDDDLDIVVASTLAALNEPHALVFLNDGSGGFGPSAIYSFGLGTPFAYFTVVAVGDVNGDGELDLAGSSTPFGGSAGTLLGVGDGTFVPGTVIEFEGAPLHAVSLADTDRDGDLDLIGYEGDFDVPQMITARNDGAGAFTVIESVALGGSVGPFEAPLALTLGHLDGDDVLDVVTTQNFLPLGSCSSPSGTGFLSFDAVLTDLNLDGRLDPVLVTTAGVVTYLNQTSISASFCSGFDGATDACPCGNTGAPSAGCDLQQATGGVSLEAVAQETGALNRMTWSATGFPSSGTPTSIVLRATTLESTPVVFGDGLRCIGTPLVRLAAQFAVGGSVSHEHGHGTMAGGGDFYYQLWFRNTPAMFCDPSAAFNLSDGRIVSW